MGKEKYSLCTRRIFASFRPIIPFVASILAGGFLQWLIPALNGLQVIGGLVQPGIMTFSIVACRKLLDKRSFVSLGLRKTHFLWGDILLGLCTIFLATVAIFLANWAFGWIEPKNNTSWLGNVTIFAALETAGTVLFSSLVKGWWEELLFRGYMFKNMAWSTNIIISALMTSAIFGSLHIFNYLQQRLTALDCLSIFVEGTLSGLLLVFAYIRTRNLWLSIGLHAGWNSLMGSIMRLGIPQGGKPEFMTNLFASPSHTMGVNNIAILGIAAVLVFLVTNQRNRRIFRKGIAK
jgi:membrane protease YdiL (CAAX protease family)